ncbi:MerR family transcriptional regulator [Nocardia sp. CDC159]|uniref:MerR family transcriptional regulator n=1 Tax=Nocardia pulmonis TaxID=2951408 RepID=A0A9X2IZX9_9NOCA|nr:MULTISPECIES: MerR family transcriptional regulator [Nocardia]MCM6777144.1 MerR family transcriptional regulator [Nocardia pulmonis]MCM6790029.1 MerR family transcriptional regulator [Nocardia sp. CDC159]
MAQQVSATPTRDGFTIDQAAAFAGVTVPAVHHYHQQGLVAEPRQDSSGQRRYRSADLMRLVQVRTLAGAGVPLTEIGDLLDYLAHVERVLDGSSKQHDCDE